MADKVVVTKDKITTLADTIRNLYGTTLTYTLEEIKAKMLECGKPVYLTTLVPQTPLAAQGPTYTGSNFYTFPSGDLYLKANAVYVVPAHKSGRFVLYRLVLTDEAFAQHTDLGTLYEAMAANSFANCTMVFSKDVTAGDTVSPGIYTYNLKVPYTSASAHSRVILIAVMYDTNHSVMSHDIYDYGKALQNNQTDTQYVYTGPHSVTPSASAQTLAVKGKILRDDITVQSTLSAGWQGPYSMTQGDAFEYDYPTSFTEISLVISDIGVTIQDDEDLFLTFSADADPVQGDHTFGADIVILAEEYAGVELNRASFTVVNDAFGRKCLAVGLSDSTGEPIDFRTALHADDPVEGTPATAVFERASILAANFEFSGAETSQVYIK